MKNVFLGEYIKQRRLDLGLTQEQLCDGICEPMTLSRLENGKQTPSRNRINALLQRLGLPDDRYFALLSKNELEMEALQKEIVACNANHRVEEGFETLKKFEQMPVFWICAVATRIAQNVQKKAGRLASNMGTINIYHIVLKSKLNALISWEMTKKARISIVNAIICARSSNTRKDWKLPKRKQKNIWAWNLKLKELHRPPETRHITAYPIRPGLRAVLFRSRQSEAWASLQVQRQSRGQPADWWPEQ